MRSIVALFSLLTLGAAPPGTTPARLISPAPSCQNLQIAQSTDGRLFRKLGQLPPAEAYQAVYRLGADGCIDPLLVGDRVRRNQRARR